MASRSFTPKTRWQAALVVAVAALHMPADAHVTIRTSGPVRPSGSATISVSVPNERHVDTVRIVVDVPDEFLRAGGRVSRVEYPPDWQVSLEKQTIPEDIFSREAEARRTRLAERAAAVDHAAAGSGQADTKAEDEEAAMEQMRRQWIKRVAFENGAIPPDGWTEFRLNIQTPETPGSYRFPTVQVYADGKEVGWTQLVEGADRPAPTLMVGTRTDWTSFIWPALSVLAIVISVVAAMMTRRRPASSR